MGTQLDAQGWLDLLNGCTNIISQYSFTKANDKIQELDMPPNWGFLWIVYELEPNPADASGFSIQNPYSAHTGLLNQMATLTDSGYLEKAGEAAYKFTSKGRTALLSAVQEIFASATHLDILDDEAELNEFADVMAQLIKNALNAPAFEKKGSIKRNHTSYPGNDAHSLTRIFQYLTDMNAYRDDCHMATWRWNYDIDGPAWESFTFIWREDAQTPTEVLEKLPFRGHDESVYVDAFASLKKLGWIAKNTDGKFEVTAEGRTVREEAEALTDEYYMNPIKALGADAEKLANWLTILQEKTTAAQDRQVKLNLWGKLQQILTTMTPHYQGTTNPMLQEIGATGLNWGVLFQAQGVSPDLLTVKAMHKAAPFNSKTVLQDRIDQTVEKGLLEAVDGGYAMTEIGQKGIDAFFSLAHQALSDFEPLPSEDLKKLATYLKQIVDKTTADGPALKINFDNSRKTDPGAGLSHLAQIDQYVTDLARYRDDAHNAVWRELDVTPFAWDALTQIWNENANTAEAINEQLQNRQVGVETYAEALASLVERGWLTENNGDYALTTEGQAIRDDAEIQTDANFFVGWQDLVNQDLGAMRTITDNLNQELKMQGYLKIWQTGQDAMAAFAPFYTPVTRPLMQEAGYEGSDWFYSYLAWGAEPQPFGVALMDTIAPYSDNEAVFAERVAGTVERGFLTAVEGGYQLTDKGRATIQGFFSNAYDAIAELELLPDEQMQVLNDILKKVVEDTIASDYGTDFLEISRVTHPVGTNLAAQIDQYLTDLIRWRDDAHITAWQEPDLAGAELEALTFIWKGEHTTAAAILEQRQGRGYTTEDYQGFIANLAERGLVVAVGDGYAVTDEGRTLRDDIETRTNEIFFSAWENLAGFQQFQLMNLLTQLRTKLQELAPEPETA